MWRKDIAEKARAALATKMEGEAWLVSQVVLVEQSLMETQQKMPESQNKII